MPQDDSSRQLVAEQWAHFRDTVLADVRPPLDAGALRLAEYVYRFAAHGMVSFLDALRQLDDEAQTRRVFRVLLAEADEYAKTKPRIVH